ncbi:6-phosphogluconolactonase [Phaeodactylum tricornutum CCAP 1055/1]|uniref:6-phosphogluconolactonase n=2 Tax=Phaeodactylum tricornutum TaxID=2850 RepID=B7G6E5_PHATC|nr:6-phosphogluconolactonase [Phaeodactylum tricornutum CCAP 1055/1]EEC45846.1 6-phosphogluconolactonase [Phaeodactylum tricornutum CCAP 1055/1]|eukprot:XP_002182559.1 6-phosphogluconolactonase [Phaeodactylum tricornutum CCAP 1055/1]
MIACSTNIRNLQLLLCLTWTTLCHGFVPSPIPRSEAFLQLLAHKTPVVLSSNVEILPDASAVGARIRAIVEDAAEQALAEKGSFALAIPGGSILQMLCVPVTDSALATHAKACKLFLDDWKGCATIVMDGTEDGPAEAVSYESKIRALSPEILPVVDGLPVFDLALIGVGDDGHIGSLYPGREEALVGCDGSWVLSVGMKQPPSITLSLPVMKAAKQVVVAACGVSDKYPQGKSDGMRRAIADENETISTFPAVGLRDVATWVLDQAAASKLGVSYGS